MTLSGYILLAALGFPTLFVAFCFFYQTFVSSTRDRSNARNTEVSDPLDGGGKGSQSFDSTPSTGVAGSQGHRMNEKTALPGSARVIEASGIPPKDSGSLPVPLIADYRLLRELGTGLDASHCRTFLANAVSADTRVVVKCVPTTAGPLQISRLQRETEVYEKDLPGTPKFVGSGSANGFRYLAIEHVDGFDLQRLINHHGPLPAERVVEIGIIVCGVLQKMHSANLLHRDLKPGNLLQDQKGSIFLIDFGLVMDATAPQPEGKAIAGSPAYMSPEAVECKPLSPASDLYSLGCVLYFLLEGEPPIGGNNALQICWRQINHPPKKFSQATVAALALQEVIMDCLRKQPSARPKSADELSRILESI